MKTIVVLVALTLTSCSMGVRIVDIHARVGRAADHNETVSSTGAYVATAGTVEFRGVEMLEALPSAFWDLATSIGGQLLAGTGIVQAPTDRTEWLATAKDNPVVSARLYQMARTYQAAELEAAQELSQ